MFCYNIESFIKWISMSKSYLRNIAQQNALNTWTTKKSITLNNWDWKSNTLIIWNF